MFGISNYLLFVIAGITLNIIPGPDTLYILGNSVARGRTAGILSVFGILAGCLVHVSAAALGLSVVLARSSAAFETVKIAGALYLAFLGITTLLSRGAFPEQEGGQVYNNPRRIFYQGFLTNLLNPKVALFFLSFLPQFVKTDNAYGPLPFLILGITFMTTGAIWCLILALSASRMTELLRNNTAFNRILSKGLGLLFLGIAADLFLAKRS
jgi:threonine/homoserine/homoserine lactone efflux protein